MLRWVLAFLLVLTPAAAVGRDLTPEFRCKAQSPSLVLCDSYRMHILRVRPHWVVRDDSGGIVDQADGWYSVELRPPADGAMTVEVWFTQFGNWQRVGQGRMQVRQRQPLPWEEVDASKKATGKRDSAGGGDGTAFLFGSEPAMCVPERVVHPPLAGVL